MTMVRCLLTLLLLAPTFASSAPRAPASPSRPASSGCQWAPFESSALGLRLLVEQCNEPSSRYVFSTAGNRLEQHRPADDRTFGSHVVLEIFSKSPAQSITQAIEQQFIAKLPRKARASCKVKALDSPQLGAGKQAFTLVPTGDYAKAINEELQQYPRDFGCGDYGKDQAETYFEYHPAESKTRFAFVVYGFDEPLFDEKSLEFLPDRAKDASK